MRTARPSAITRPIIPHLLHLHDHVPSYKGHHIVRRALERLVSNGRAPFLWRMDNGDLLAIDPREGRAVRETVGWACYLNRCWEPHVERALLARLGPGRRAMDVGANIGYTTMAMAGAVGSSGRVDAFEPLPDTFRLLELSKLANSLDHVHLHQVALGDRRAQLSISFDPELRGNASLHAAVSATAVQVDIDSVRLDDLVTSGMVPPPDVLKLDVEGHELAVLRGAPETLAESRPAIVVEMNDQTMRSAGWGPADLETALEPLGRREYICLWPAERRIHRLNDLCFRRGEFYDVAIDPL